MKKNVFIRYIAPLFLLLVPSATAFCGVTGSLIINSANKIIAAAFVYLMLPCLWAESLFGVKWLFLLSPFLQIAALFAVLYSYHRYKGKDKSWSLKVAIVQSLVIAVASWVSIAAPDNNNPFHFLDPD